MTENTRERSSYKDWREEKPSLHLLYVKWAVQHLTVIDRYMKELGDFNNSFLLDMQTAVGDERAYLIKNNPAYADADEIIKRIAASSMYPGEERNDLAKIFEDQEPVEIGPDETST